MKEEPRANKRQSDNSAYERADTVGVSPGLSVPGGQQNSYEALKFLKREWEFGLIAEKVYQEQKKAILSRLEYIDLNSR